MRVLVLQPPARQQHAFLDQRRDHGFIGITLLALVVDNALAREAGRVIGEGAVLIDGIWNFGVDSSPIKLSLVLHPDIEVFAAMPGCGVHESRASIVGYVVAFEKRNDKIIAVSP